MNFDAAVIGAVTSHMNGDHVEDNILIAKAFGYPGATASVMVGLDAHSGVWAVTDATGEHELRLEWPGAPIVDRPQVRSEVVKLYTAACAKLGVPARDEHQPGAGSEGGAHAAHTQGDTQTPAAHAADPGSPTPFSQVIRESSWSDHSSSEGASFMEDIMRGIASRQDYVDLVAQHFFMYEALEEVATKLADDPRYAMFHPAALLRMAAIEADLEFLVGADWRGAIRPVPATAAYAARMREIGAEGWLAGIVAHHYTRYLGDLSGGQMIARRVAKQHGFSGQGIDFYDFESLGSIADFKQLYRTGLDALGELLDADEQRRMLDEVRAAYAFNTQVFVDLAKQKAAE